MAVPILMNHYLLQSLHCNYACRAWNFMSFYAFLFKEMKTQNKIPKEMAAPHLRNLQQPTILA